MPKQSRRFFLSLVIFALSYFNFPITIFADTSSTKVRFYAFGDWGTGKPEQKEVADRIAKVCRERGCDFGVALGDNFYNRGVKSIDDPLWKTRYRDLYPKIGVPFFAVLGNHDYKGNEQAQIEYSKIDPTWKMPGHFFSLAEPDPAKPIVEIFFLDSQKFTQEAGDWLEKTLSASKAPWKFLAFHHPLLDNGTQHTPDPKHLYPKIKSIICGKIDLIFSGHEHFFSHLKNPKDTCGWSQLILGTGGMKLHRIKKHPPPNTQVLYSESSHGTGYLEVTEEKLNFYFIRSDGAIPYRFDLNKPKATPKKGPSF